MYILDNESDVSGGQTQMNTRHRDSTGVMLHRHFGNTFFRTAQSVKIVTTFSLLLLNKSTSSEVSFGLQIGFFWHQKAATAITVRGYLPCRRLGTMVMVLVWVRRLRVPASPPAKTPLKHQVLQALQLTVQCLILVCGRAWGGTLLTCNRGE